MPQVAFRIGNAPFFTYTLLAYLGVLAAAGMLAWEGRRRGWSAGQALEVLVWAVVPGVLGGRLTVALGLWAGDVAGGSLFHEPWGEGLSFPGALLAGAAGLALLAALRGRAYRRGEALGESCAQAGPAMPSPNASPLQAYVAILGAVLPGLALAQALGWLGAAAHGASAGIPLPLAWRWAPHLRNLYGVVVPRFPLQYLAVVLSLVTWALLTWGRLRSDRGRVACYLLLTGWGLMSLGWSLERRVPVVAGLTLDQIAYLGLGLLGLAVALATVRRWSPRPVPDR